MIFEALELLRVELQDYAHTFSSTIKVEIGSINNVAGNEEEKILISLINIEEETALRNATPSFVRNAVGELEKKQPPIYLNLYVLISANYSTELNYPSALKWLGRIIQCFQKKTVFTMANTPNAVVLPAEAATLKVTTEIYSLTFEKLNQMWGTLGGKQVPSIVYKLRVVEEQATFDMGVGSAILTVEGRSTPVFTQPN